MKLLILIFLVIVSSDSSFVRAGTAITDLSTTAPSDARSIAVTGKVHDTQGQVLAGVQVICTVLGTDFRNETVTTADGSFTIRALTHSENLLTGSLEDYWATTFKVNVGTDDVDLSHRGDFVLQTMEEVYAEMGQNREQRPLTPEEEAIGIYNQAVEAYQSGDYEKAEMLARAAHGKDPKQASAIKLLVYSNMKTNDWPEVLEFSDKYLELHPEDQQTRKAALHAAQMTDNTARAAELEIGLRAQPTPDSLFGDAVARLNADDDAGARKLLEQLLEQDPRYSRAHFEMGKIHIREFEFDEAIKSLERYLKYADSNDSYRAEASDLIITLAD